MKKTFDCVAMKQRGADAVRATLAGMTAEQEVEWWQRRGSDLRQRQRKVLAAAGASALAHEPR